MNPTFAAGSWHVVECGDRGGEYGVDGGAGRRGCRGRCDKWGVGCFAVAQGAWEVYGDKGLAVQTEPSAGGCKKFGGGRIGEVVSGDVGDKAVDGEGLAGGVRVTSGVRACMAACGVWGESLRSFGSGGHGCGSDLEGGV